MGSVYPQYELYLEGTNGARFFLMSARRKKKARGATYLISLNRFDSGNFDERVVAKVKCNVFLNLHRRSNFLGTLFTVYDGRRDKERNERAAILYQPNIFGLCGPRKMTLLLPGLTAEGRIKPLTYKSGSCQLHEKFKTDEIAEILVMRNKTPQWNDGTNLMICDA
jgi:hypothetical protein